jgi:hypothetical protein
MEPIFIDMSILDSVTYMYKLRQSLPYKHILFKAPETVALQIAFFQELSTR